MSTLSPRPKLARQHRNSRRREIRLEHLEVRTLLSSISESGGVGGITKTLALPGELNLVNFTWQNYTIPDEFQIQFGGQRIAGDVGLQSGGHTGKTVVAAPNMSGFLTVKVTAPTQGTAWDFTVEANPLELKVDAKLGDVTKVSIGQLFKAATGQTLAAVGLDPTSFQFVSMSNAKGKVAEIDNWQSELKKGVFYFDPTVAGTPLNYGAHHTSDAGLGDSQLLIRGTVTDAAGSRAVEFPVKFTVTDGFSTSFSDPELMQTIPAVNGSGTTKLDHYRQEQRLAYLGFAGGSAGQPIKVDGVLENNEWAEKAFSIAVDPAKTGLARGHLPSPVSGTKYFKSHINDANAPFWQNLRGTIPGLSFPGGSNQSQRFFGTNATGLLITNAHATFNANLVSTGASQKSGSGAPSHSHDGGRAIDIDLIPGNYFFKETIVAGPGGGSFVSSAGGGFIVRNPNGTYRGGGNPQSASDRANGLRTSTLAGSTTPALVSSVANLLDYAQTVAEVQRLINAFLGAGSDLVYYNDPRFFTATGIIKFQVPHFDHIHFGIPSPISGSPTSTLLSGAGLAPLALAAPQSGGRLSTAADLGRLDTTLTASGTLDGAHPELIYRFQIGNGDEDAAFDTPRDLSALLNGLAANADVELIVDPNGDGIGQVLDSSSNSGTAADSFTAMQLSSGTYYIRVFKQASDTSFNLSLSLAALPVPADGAGNTIATAANLGTLSGTLVKNDFVGQVDSVDNYQFHLNTMSNVDLTVDGLDQGDVALAIGQDTNGDGVLTADEFLSFSDDEANNPESLHLSLLPAGNYIVQVLQVSGSTNYQLHLTAAAAAAPADRAGDTIASAFNIGPLTAPATFNDFVGSVDPTDVVHFSVGALTGIVINLSGLSADADVELVRDANQDGVLSPDEVLASSHLSGTSDESITLAGLASGDYYVRVVQSEGDTNYNMSIAPMAASGANLAVARTDTTPPADLGTQFTYTLRVTNNGPDTATNVKLTESLLSGLSVVQTTKSVPGGSIQNNGNGFLATLPSLASGQSVTFDVTVKSFIAGMLAATSSVTSDTPDYDTTNNILQDNLTVSPITSPPADLELTQTVSDLNPQVGGQIIFTLSLTNKGPGTATDIKVSDVLPAGLTYVSSTADLGSYDPATGIWTAGNEQPNDTFHLRLTAAVAAARTLTNTAEVVAVAESDPNSTPNNHQPGENDQATVLVVPAGATADLALTQMLSNLSPQVGDQIAVTLTMTNSGPGTATGVQVHDLLPAGLTYVSSSATLGGYDPGTGLWTIASIPNGTNAQLRVTARVAAGTAGTVTNTAEVVATDQSDPDSTPNNHKPGEDDQTSATAILVRAIADLALTQTLSNLSPQVGDQISVTLTLTNSGPGTATGVHVHDLFPAGLTYVSSSATLGGYDPGTGLWTIASIPNGTNAQLRVIARVAGTVTNTAEIVSMDQSDPDSTPNNHRPGEDDQVSVTVTPVITRNVPLTVTQLQRFGIHAQPSTLVLTFNTRLDPVSAQNAANYRIIGPGGRIILVRSTVYSPSMNTITLTPQHRLGIHYRYTLIVNGTSPGGLHTPAGSFLNGGKNYVSSISRNNLVVPHFRLVADSYCIIGPGSFTT